MIGFFESGDIIKGQASATSDLHCIIWGTESSSANFKVLYADTLPGTLTSLYTAGDSGSINSILITNNGTVARTFLLYFRPGATDLLMNPKNAIVPPDSTWVWDQNGIRVINKQGGTLGVAGLATDAALAECRLEYNSATQVRLNRYNGRILAVNGEAVLVDGSAGADQLNTTDNLISALGADAGAAMAASTLYYVYRSNSQPAFAASDLRASATGPSEVNGVKYLGSTGDAAHWRFVGWVRTNASTQFVNSLAARLVRSLFHPLRAPVRAVRSTASWTYATNAWRPFEGDSATKVECIGDGIHSSSFYVSAAALGASAANNFAVGIGIDSSSSPDSDSINTFGGDSPSSSRVVVAMSAEAHKVLSQGYHEVWALENTPDAASVTFYGTNGLTGVQTGLTGEVLI